MLLFYYPIYTHAQQPSEIIKEGIHSGLLVQAINALAQRKCPENIMSALLRAQCSQTILSMAQSISAFGKVTGTELVGVQHTPMGPAEVYNVSFSKKRFQESGL